MIGLFMFMIGLTIQVTFLMLRLSIWLIRLVIVGTVALVAAVSTARAQRQR